MRPNRWRSLSFVKGGGPMLEFLPLVARDSIPSSQLAWHSYVEAPSPFRPLQLLHDRDVVAGRRAAETAGCDALSLGRNSNARSRQDLRPRMLHCLTNVTLLQESRRSTIIAALRCRRCTLEALKRNCMYTIMSSASNQNKVLSATCTLYRFSVE